MLARLAEATQLSAPMITQILNGEKNLSPEAAFSTAQFMGLEEDELHYFLLLVQLARAGSHGLRTTLQKQVRAEKRKASELKRKIKPDRELDELTKQRFYSDWLYSGLRNMTACPEFQTVDAIAAHLRLARPTVQKVIEFLLQQGLCVQKNGRLNVGPQFTHLEPNHPLVLQHHKNWRLKGMSKMSEKGEDDLFFTAPLSLSNADAEKVRALLPEFIEQIRKVVGPSESETVRCMNLDWFSY